MGENLACNMRSRVILIVILFGLSTILPVQGGSPEDLDDVGVVFGGVYVDANTSGNSTSQLSDLPAIVEDYTATWCTNCVKVEHALDDVEATNNMQQYHFHRFIGESEDPFGSQEGDDRWIERYDQRQPPTVVFNGTIKQVGSVPSGDSLQDDYNTNLQNSLSLGQGTSTLGWVAATDDSSAIATWNLVIDTDVIPEGATINSSIWVVEHLAYFPDGSNGEDYYHDSVRAIIELGDSMSGSLNITLPASYDDADLQIHLIHEVVLSETVPDTTPDPNEDNNEEESIEEESGLPSISLMAVLAITMFAAITVQRKQQ